MLDRLHNLLTSAGFKPTESAIGRDNKYQLNGQDAAWTDFTYDAAGGIFEVSFNPEGLAHFLDRVERLEKALEQLAGDANILNDEVIWLDHSNGLLPVKDVPELAQYLAEREAAK